MALTKQGVKNFFWNDRTTGAKVATVGMLLATTVLVASWACDKHGSSEAAEVFGRASKGLFDWLASTTPAATATKLLTVAMAGMFGIKEGVNLVAKGGVPHGFVPLGGNAAAGIAELP